MGAGRCLGLTGLAYLANSLKVGDPVLEGGGGRGRGAGKEEKGFYLAALCPSCEQVFISSSGDHSHHHHSFWWPLGTPVLVHVSLVHSLSASKENWSKWFGPVSIMGLLPFLTQVGRSFCSSLQVRDHHQALGAAVLAGPTRGSQGDASV